VVNVVKRSIAFVVLAFMICVISLTMPVYAQTTTVAILPSSVTISAPGETVTVDLNITDVTNLYGYEIKIWYLNSIVNATAVTRPSGHFLEPTIDPNNFYSPKWEIKNDYNTTHGRIWIAYTLLAPESARSGSGILAKITFKGLSEGSTPVILNNYPGAQGPVKLSDNQAQPIPHVAQDGSVTVIPEFSTIAITMFLLSSLTVAVAIKLFRFRKPKMPAK
jgi:hypothetical protein